MKTAQTNVQDIIAQTSSLVQSGKWDDALSALNPLKKYLGQFSQLDSIYGSANGKSYDFHLQAAGEKLQKNSLEQALKEYETALLRKPDSAEALAGRKEVLIRKTISDSHVLRQQKKPDKAREQMLALVSQEPSVAQDSRLASELKLASCEYGSQLLSAAQRLALSPAKKLKPLVTAAAEKTFIEANEKLALAQSVCTSKAAGGLLDRVGTALTDFHLGHARRAKARGALAAALLYSQAALRYAPSNAEAKAIAEQMEQSVRDKVQVRVGVLFRDASPGQSCQQEASALTHTMESQISGSTHLLLESNQAEELYRTPQSQKPPNYALILGKIQSCSVQKSVQDQPIQSKYRVPNPDYNDAKSAEQSAEQQYRSCRAVNGEANCGYARESFETTKAQRRNTQEWLKYDYTYSQRATTVYGNMSVLLQVLSASSPNTLGPFQEEIRDQCIEQVGVRDDDDAKAGIMGTVMDNVDKFLAARHPSQNHCPLSEDEQYKSTVQQNMQQKLRLA
ncbi:MAG TPA: hypothetical protein VJ723_11740, partial [Candidatus Angelobacter sp.]|nr:hypothetical protein [Candidatus Angelobacter sp.]